MLIQFSVNNYKSYKDAQSFTMIPGKYRLKPNHVVRKKQANILKFSSIYGGNASGKSNFVDAIALTRKLVVSGKMSPFKKELFFKLNQDNQEKPSNFEYKILVNDRIFIYGFSLSFTREVILQEYLYEIQNKKEILYFDFDYAKGSIEFNEAKIKNKDNEKKIEVYKDDFSHNQDTFFLRFINDKQFKEEELFFDLKNVFQWFKSVLLVISPQWSPDDIVRLFNEDVSHSHYSMIDLVKSFDTGITDFKTKTLTLEEFQTEMNSFFSKNQREKMNDFLTDIASVAANVSIRMGVGDKYYQFRKKADSISFESLKFEHCQKNCAEFEFGEESDGSKRIIELVNLLYSVQFQNRVIIVDELNRSLHPNLTLDFVEKFIELAEKTDSQLIVTNHDSTLMDLDVVRQDEIWVVDRAPDGSSNLFSLSRYKIRNDKVLNKDYLIGRYGGIPQLNKLLALKKDSDG